MSLDHVRCKPFTAMRTMHPERCEPTQVAERLRILWKLLADLICNGCATLVNHRL